MKSSSNLPLPGRASKVAARPVEARDQTILDLSTRENDFGRGSLSLGQERRPILLFKNEGAARALVCSGVTRSEKAFVSQRALEAPMVSPFGKKSCDINERHNPF